MSANDLSAVQNRLSAILCLEDSCTRWPDWLTYVPNGAPAWVLGALALLASGKIFYVGWERGNLTVRVYLGGCAMIELFISLFLRASLSLETGNKEAMYLASLFFNYHAGFTLGLFIIFGLFTLARRRGGERSERGEYLRLVAISLTALVIPTVLGAVGVAKMFSMGTHLVQTAVLLVLAQILVFGGLALVRGRRYFKELETRAQIVFTLVTFMLLLWSSFMVAQSFTLVGNVARKSEVLFYLLNYAPLLVSGLALNIHSAAETREKELGEIGEVEGQQYKDTSDTHA